MTDARPIVIAAAIKGPCGRVHSVPRPGRHADVIRQIIEGGHASDHGTVRFSDGFVQGFVDSLGRFLNRRQAASVAVRSGQCRREDLSLGELLSENVW